MKIEIRRGTINDRFRYFEIVVDGKEMCAPQASRKITGTTYEFAAGVFNSCVDGQPVQFWCGEHTRRFQWAPIDFKTTPAPELSEAFRVRVTQVQDWVKTIDREEIIQISI